MLNAVFSLQPNSNIHNKNFCPQNLNSKPVSRLVKSSPCDKVSFSCNVPKSNAHFELLEKQIKATGLRVNEIIKRTLFTEESLLLKKSPIGEGGDSKVFEIPGLDDFVLKVYKGNDNLLMNSVKHNEVFGFVQITDPFEGKANFGQSVAILTSSGKRMADNLHEAGETIFNGNILLKQKGTEHSIQGWTHFVEHPQELTVKQVQKFLGDITKVASLPQKAFDNFAKSIKLLTEKDFKMDSINPNNLLIDKDAINIVDFFYPREDLIPDFKNSYFDMIGSLLDFRLFEHYHNLLDKNHQKELENASKTIIQKSLTAAKNPEINLTTDEQVYAKYLTKLDEIYIGSGHVQSYESMKNIIKTDSAENNPKSLSGLKTFLLKAFSFNKPKE